MKSLYTQIEFDTAKCRDKLLLECEHCHGPFYKSKNRIQATIKNDDGKCKFCSPLCLSQEFEDSPSITCEQCGATVKKIKSQIKQTKHNFCCKSCAAKYNNAHKTKGTRVSKLERWLAEQLVVLYPGFEFHFNRRDAINGELDIYIPSLKLGFELNGIFHYEPIYGPEKLGRIQSNDERKILACAERGIELCVIDTYSVSYFKPTKAQMFLGIITGIIRSKISSLINRTPDS